MTSTPEPIHTSPAARSLVARTPEDIAAFVPLALGFVPERSVVMISVGGPRRSLHARVDLPHDPDDVDDVVEALLRPARRHRVQAVIFVVYDDDTVVADEACWALNAAFADAGIDVKDALRVYADQWFAVLPGRAISDYAGTRFKRSEHHFTAQGVFEGRVTHASREELRATIAADADAVALTSRHLSNAVAVPFGDLRRVVLQHLVSGAAFSVTDLAAVAVTVRSGSRRDEVWAWLERTQARRCVDLWSDAVRRLPASHVAAPAAVLAFAAWLAGDGALAWCAVDRSWAAEPGQSLATLVAGLLESATSPTAWETLRPHVEGITDPAA